MSRSQALGMESRVMDGSMQPVFVQKGEGPKSAWAAWLGSGCLVGLHG